MMIAVQQTCHLSNKQSYFKDHFLMWIQPSLRIRSFRLAIIYDKYWLAKYVTATESVNAIRRVIANAQIIFNWPSLTVPITLEVASIAFQDIAIPADGSGL